MQNKTNFRKAKMNINLGLTRNYEMNNLANPAKTKPILPAVIVAGLPVPGVFQTDQFTFPALYPSFLIR